MKLQGKTTPELLAMAAAIEAHPSSQMPPGSLWKYTLAEARAAAGRPVPCDGYSGRQSNRRR